ncbi:MAG: hypothetical protein GX616_04205 [Planctomycetes bacterium]|nr:hypothetical protein [Planctomycetota bacterium]
MQIGAIDNRSSCDRYADYTTMWTLVIPGVEYPITVTNGRPYSDDVCSIWVDWHQDKTFDDFGDELIGDVPGAGPYSFTLRVPPSFMPGYTRMRIRIDHNNPNPDPCGTRNYGEVEDYTLRVGTDEPWACCSIHDGQCIDEVTPLDCVGMGLAGSITSSRSAPRSIPLAAIRVAAATPRSRAWWPTRLPNSAPTATAGSSPASRARIASPRRLAPGAVRGRRIMCCTPHATSTTPTSARSWRPC